MAAEQKSSIKDYRPEIDGLRAISIIVIVFYHLDVSIFNTRIFPGGYLGVDVFLVISGYLIQRILGNYRSGSMLKFYQRRILRIFPALFFMILFTFPFAYFFLIPPSLIYFIKSAFAGVFALANFFFADTLAYNGEAAASNVLLHVWSLSLEEQFYLLFPVIYFSLSKFKKSAHSAALLLLVLISLALTQIGFYRVGAEFYLLPTRLFEFLIGALISLNQDFLKNKLVFFFKKYSIENLDLLSSFSLIVLFFCITLFGDAQINPSFLTLIPVLAAAVLLLTADSRGLANSFLTLPPMIYTGLVSYSLYLYHYPIIVFTKMYYGSEPSLFVVLCMLIAMAVIAILSYRFIEKPYRYRLQVLTDSKLIFLISAVLLFFVSGFYIIRSNESLERLEQAFESAAGLLKQDGKICYARDTSDLCKIGNSVNPEYTFYLVGDSIAGALQWALANSLNPSRTKFVPINDGGCAFIPGMYFHDVSKNKYKCHELNIDRQLVISKQTRPFILILSARWPLYFDGVVFDNKEGGKTDMGKVPSYFSDENDDLPSFERIEFIKDHFRKFVSDLNHKGTKVVLVYPIPEVGWYVPSLVVRKKEISVDLTDKANWLTTSYDVYKSRTQLSYSILDSVPNSENLLRVYPSKIFCDSAVKSRCITHDAFDIFYTNSSHPSQKGAELIVAQMIEEMKLKWNLRAFKYPTYFGTNPATNPLPPKDK